LLDRPRGTAFAIQQPEVHLHPRAQACLGDVFFEMAIRDKKTFIVETHSDFAIDRFRMNFRRRRSRKKSDLKPLSQILFFERREAKNTVTPIRIGDQGDMPADQPESYRRFFVKEEMRLLGF
jgi:predicted ATPase